MKQNMGRWFNAQRLALPKLLMTAIFVIFGSAVLNLVENLATDRIARPTGWLAAAVLVALSLAIFLQHRIELRIEDLHRRQRLSVQYFAGGSGAAGQAVYRAATSLIEKATCADCKILAVNSFVEVFADSTDTAAEADRKSYLRTIESKLGQVSYHRIIQLNAKDRNALTKIRIGDVISKNYGEHYKRVASFVSRSSGDTGLGASVVTRLDAVPARYPTSFVLIKTPVGSHLIWQMNEHVPQDSPGMGNSFIEEERVRLAGVFIISDPDEQITRYFERWFNELASSVQLTAVSLDQLEKSAVAPKGDEELVRELFEVIDASEWSRLPEFFDRHIVYYRPGFPVIYGLAELDRFYREVRPVAEGKHSIDSIIVSGEEVSCRGTFNGRLRDGSSADVEFSDYCRVKEGKIVERRTFFFTPSI
jgi:ketosteroid isomerase-like protein